jgi:hypothetical protein
MCACRWCPLRISLVFESPLTRFRQENKLADSEIDAGVARVSHENAEQSFCALSVSARSGPAGSVLTRVDVEQSSLQRHERIVSGSTPEGLPFHRSRSEHSCSTRRFHCTGCATVTRVTTRFNTKSTIDGFVSSGPRDISS